MKWVGTYLIGFVVLIGGVLAALWKLGMLQRIGTTWTLIGVAILIGIIKISRRHQQFRLTGRVQRGPNPSAEALARQLPQQKHGDHFVVAALADHLHADQ